MNDRKQQIQDVANEYTYEYTRAVMSDQPYRLERQACQEANETLVKKCKELQVTKEELEAALAECVHQAEQNCSACQYDVFVTRQLAPKGE